MLKWLAIHSRSPHSTNEERVHEEQRRLEFNEGTIMKNPAATEHHGKAEDSRGTNGHINTFSLQTLTETHLHHGGDGLVSHLNSVQDFCWF